MIKVSPTLQPQALNAMRRLEKTVKKNILVNGLLKKEAGSLYHMCNASITFLSGAPESNIVGATASVLLEVDEDQDVLPEKFDKDIAPMAASTNATRVFWGTAWTSRTLLGRELRAARAAEAEDGIRRVFIRTADDVSAEVPEYAHHVQETIRRQGRSHSLVRTQYFSEEIDSQGGCSRRNASHGCARRACPIPCPLRRHNPEGNTRCCWMLQEKTRVCAA